MPGVISFSAYAPDYGDEYSEEAGTWSAMSQMGGYIVGGFGPFFIGLVFDLSGHFYASIVAMLVIVSLMIGVQLSMKLGRKEEVSS